MSEDVYIIGAGFSVGLGYPLLRNLLEYVWSDIPSDDKTTITNVIKFHNPNFEPNHPFTFPDIESLLTQFEANIELFDHTRRVEGNFQKSQLINARDILLIEMAKKFHSTNKNISMKKYPWLKVFREKILSDKSTIISFNYDLVIEKILFKEGLGPTNYGFPFEPKETQILKPHGSLNWFKQNDSTGRLKKDRRQILLDKDDVAMFNYARHPKSKIGRRYTPHLIPPTFTKKFNGEVYKTTLQNSVATLSKARNVYFLGCSLPKSDFHSQFMIRCGLHNQIEGEILKNGKRKKPIGAANIIVVNPDKSAAKNTTHLISNQHKFVWKKMTVAEWAMQDSVS